MNKYDQVLKMFIKEDPKITYGMAPFYFGDFICSTNAHTLVWFDKSKSELTGIEDNSKLVEKIINGVSDTISIPLNERLQKSFGFIPLIDEMKVIKESVDCDECGGTGEVEWEYGSHTKDDDCPVCDGDGTSEERKIPTGNKVPDYKYQNIKIGISYFDSYKLKELINVSEIIGEDLILVGQSEPDKPNYFKVGDINIILMPLQGECAVIDTIASK